MNYRLSILCFFLLVIFTRCQKLSCFDNAGSQVSVRRSVASFHEIELQDNIHLVLTQDTIETVRVEAGKNLEPNIITIVENGRLLIRNTVGCSWAGNPNERITVYASVKKLDYLHYASSGNITSSNTLQADKIMFYSKLGAGTIDINLVAKETTVNIQYEIADCRFRGKSDVGIVYVNARGGIDFRDFEVKDMNLGYVGVRDAVINVTTRLEAFIFHSGNVYYKGRPSISNVTYYGKGRLYPHP